MCGTLDAAQVHCGVAQLRNGAGPTHRRASALPFGSDTLLLIGLLYSVLPLGLLRTIRRRYEQLELRKMEAQDMA